MKSPTVSDLTDPADVAGDFDGDGLDNLAEFELGTDPNDADSDGDGLKDGEEVALGTDPTDGDSDGDGTNNGAEVTAGRDPTVKEPAAIIGAIYSILNSAP